MTRNHPAGETWPSEQASTFYAVGDTVTQYILDYICRGVVKKLSDGVGSFLGLKPSDDKRKPAPAPPQYDPRLPSPPGLIGGLLGRAAGSLLGAAVQTLAKEVR
jgi:hypothetical protein